jgi:hypothetical protein
MVWSIYKDTSSSHVEDWQENYAAWYYDYDMETDFPPNRVKFLHDGTHLIFFKHDKGEFSTAVDVIDGKFTESTYDSIMQMVEESGYWGDFVEGFVKRDHKIRVIMGS